MKKRIIISSILTIALCFSLIAGSTFALFTSEQKIDVSVAAGNVEIVATVENIQLSSALGENLAETSATFDETSNTVTLDKIVPGDKVTFDLRITNKSDVGINYRTVISKLADDGLWAGLVVTIDGVTYEGEVKTSAWGKLAPASEDIVVPVVVELPVDAGNEYKKTSCTFSYKVEAVQGNATPISVTNATELAAAVNSGENPVFVEQDIVMNDQTLVIGGNARSAANTDVVIDLNGHTISGISTSKAASKLIEVKAGAKLTLRNGTVTFGATTPDTEWGGEGQPAYPGYANNTISCRGTLVIDGATVENKTAKGGASYAIDCYEGADVTVNGGMVIQSGNDIAIRMFSGSATNACNVTINGGKVVGYRAVWVQLPSNKPDVAPLTNLTVNGGVLVSSDTNYHQTIYSYSYGNSFDGTTIVLNGGTYIGDVALGGGSKVGAHTFIFNETACTVYGEVYSYNDADGVTDYTGIITDATPVVESSVFQSGALEDKEILLLDDVTAPLANSAIYGTPVAVVLKSGCVLDGNGNSLDIAKPQYNGYAIETYGNSTIKNLTIDTTVGRGIVISSPVGDTVIENVVIDGPGYAINTTEHNGNKLIVTNSTVKGWTSFAGLESATFTSCIFGENTAKYWQNMGYDQDFDRLIRPYVTATFTSCEFEQGYYIDLSALGAEQVVTLTGCVCNGVELTAENYAEYITVEEGSNGTLVINGVTIFAK